MDLCSSLLKAYLSVQINLSKEFGWLSARCCLMISRMSIRPELWDLSEIQLRQKHKNATGNNSNGILRECSLSLIFLFCSITTLNEILEGFLNFVLFFKLL